MSRSAPQTLGKYELVREIGRGSMATVYLARDPFALREVAIKVSSHRTGSDERTDRRRRKLFYNESKAAGLLSHPNIVATIDAGEDDGVRFIVMEYVSGAQTLDKYCREPNLLPVSNVIEVILKCALAFDYAHSNGVIHRDVKPKNILLTPENEVKLGDFGVAFIDREDVEDTQVIGTLGSPRYMAPEQVTGGVVGKHTDLFALGVVAYELLTGIHPFAGRTVAQIVRRIVREPYQRIRTARPEVPVSLERVIDRVLKKHPAGRYATAMDLAGDLSLVYDDVRLASHGPDTSKRLQALKAITFFADFEESELREVINSGQWVKIRAGTEILVEGERADSFFVVVAGSAAVVCGGEEVSVLMPGASFGELGFIVSQPTPARIIARSEVTALKLRASQIEHSSMSVQSRFQRALLRTMAVRLTSVMGYVLDKSQI